MSEIALTVSVLALRELGIVLFLSVVGLKSGGDFVRTLSEGDGLSWIGYGIFIIGIPLLTVAFAFMTEEGAMLKRRLKALLK